MITPKSKDYDLRVSLVDALLREGISADAIRHEITLDTSSCGGRVDVAVVLDTALIGFELKSASDVLKRCESQSNAYDKSFDYHCLVIDQKHKDNFHRHSFSEAFVYYPDKALCLSDFRRLAWGDVHRKNRTISASMMLRLLWAPELREINRQFNAHGDSRELLTRTIPEIATLRDIRRAVAKMLRGRPRNRWEESFFQRRQIALIGESAE